MYEVETILGYVWADGGVNSKGEATWNHPASNGGSGGRMKKALDAIHANYTVTNHTLIHSPKWLVPHSSLPPAANTSKLGRREFLISVIEGEGNKTTGMVMDDPDQGHINAIKPILQEWGLGWREDPTTFHRIYVVPKDSGGVFQSWPFAAWGRVPGGQGTPTPNPPPVPPPVPALKQKPAGLYYTNGPKINGAGIDHAVIDVPWSAVENTQGIFNWKGIDSIIASYPNWKFRLRLQSGMWAPDWVLGQGNVTVMGPKSGTIARVPLWWTNAYLMNWDDLMAKTAARYDNEPRILDIVNAGPMTINAEPFIRSGSDINSNKVLCAAGYSLANDKASHVATLASILRYFTKTRASLALHTAWQIPQPDGKVSLSWATLRDFINPLRIQYGDRLLFQDNGLSPTDSGTAGDPKTSTTLWDWFASVAKQGTIIGFQTKGDSSMPPGKGIIDAVNTAIKLGGYFVEHNQFGTDAQAKPLDQQLKARGQ